MLSDDEKKKHIITKLEKNMIEIDMETQLFSGPYFKGCWLIQKDILDWSSFSQKYNEISKWDSEKDKKAMETNKNYILVTDGTRSWIMHLDKMKLFLDSSIPEWSERKSGLRLCFSKYDFYIPRSIFWRSFLELHSGKFNDNGIYCGEENNPQD